MVYGTVRIALRLILFSVVGEEGRKERPPFGKFAKPILQQTDQYLVVVVVVVVCVCEW